eukprot:g65065.t1
MRASRVLRRLVSETLTAQPRTPSPTSIPPFSPLPPPPSPSSSSPPHPPPLPPPPPLWSSTTTRWPRTVSSLGDVHGHGARSLLPAAYSCPRFYAAEQKQVFEKGWVPVGYLNQLSPSTEHNFFTHTVAGQSFLITRDPGSGTLHAFHNVCRHRGCQLVTAQPGAALGTPEKCPKRKLVCPYHRWSYSLSGQLLASPDYHPSDGEAARLGLYPVPLSVFKNLLFVNVGGNCDTVCGAAELFQGAAQEWGSWPLEECVIVRHKQYALQCNWKVPVENLLEYYHLPSVHRVLNQTSKKDAHKMDLCDGWHLGCRTDPLQDDGSAISPSAIPAMPGVWSARARAGHWHALFPNLFLFVLPHHVFACIVEPTGPTSCIEHAALLVHPSVRDTHAKEIDNVWRYWDEVNAEDVAICERVQRGLTSRAFSGG